jgi:protein-tyrosine phosphatase
MAGCMRNISQITEYLFVSAWPEASHAEYLLALNIRLILSMHWLRPAKELSQPPLKLLWLPTMDSPLTPIPIGVLERGVKAALPVARSGGAVLVHCHYGIHRSVAMASCILIGMGFTAGEAMGLVKEKRPAADPYIGYIQKRILRFENSWDHHP